MAVTGAAAAAFGASSYSMDFTWFIGIVREDLSSPASVISEAELLTTLPAIVEPSRMVTVAWGRSDSLVAQDNKRNANANVSEIGFGIKRSLHN